jgi:phospholipid transport system transporter-binding protein
MMQTFKPSNAMIFDTVIEDKRRLSAFVSELQASTWVFDLSQVQTCDSAGIALLIEAKRLSQLENRSCLFQGTTAAINALIEFCGVENVLR